MKGWRFKKEKPNEARYIVHRWTVHCRIRIIVSTKYVEERVLKVLGKDGKD